MERTMQAKKRWKTGRNGGRNEGWGATATRIQQNKNTEEGATKEKKEGARRRNNTAKEGAPSGYRSTVGTGSQFDSIRLVRDKARRCERIRSAKFARGLGRAGAWARIYIGISKRTRRCRTETRLDF
jgi:hypothetical protein